MLEEEMLQQTKSTNTYAAVVDPGKSGNYRAVITDITKIEICSESLVIIEYEELTSYSYDSSNFFGRRRNKRFKDFERVDIFGRGKLLVSITKENDDDND